MSCGACGGDVVSVCGFKVAGGGETGKISGASCSDCGIFVCAAGSHFHDSAAFCSGDHACCCGGDGGVRVHDGEDDCFEDDAFCEGAAEGQDGGVGEVEFAFTVAIDVSGKAVVAEVFNGVVAEEVKVSELVVGEDEVSDRA